MPIVGAVVLSLMLIVSYTGSNQIQRNLSSNTPSQFRIPVRAYEPPARKSVVVANDGRVYTMAGMIHPTRRDRSQEVRFNNRPVAEPRISIVEKDFTTAPASGPVRVDATVSEPIFLPVAQETVRPIKKSVPAKRVEPVSSRQMVAAQPATQARPVEPVKTEPLFIPEDVKIIEEPVYSAPAEPIHLTGTEVVTPDLLNPDDSAYSPSDALITNRIRQSIVNDNSLYIVSMHVRIDTTNGKVTLKGEVSTKNDKDIIGEKAARVAGAANVDNQLAYLVSENH